MKNILWSLVFFLFTAGICSAQTVLYFPQFVDGTQDRNSVVWATVLGVTNPAAPSTPAATGTITLTKDNGAPMNVTLFDINTGAIGNTFQLAGGQTKVFASASVVDIMGPQPLNTGFATVTSNLPVAGFLFFQDYGPYGTNPKTGQLIAEAAVLSATPLMRQETGVVQYAPQGTSTAIAVANPGTATANITFQLLDNNGNQIGSPVMRALAPNNHTAFFVPDLFPNVPPTLFGGSLRITSDTPLVSTGLFFQGNLFASLPIIPLP